MIACILGKYTIQHNDHAHFNTLVKGKKSGKTFSAYVMTCRNNSEARIFTLTLTLISMDKVVTLHTRSHGFNAYRESFTFNLGSLHTTISGEMGFLKNLAAHFLDHWYWKLHCRITLHVRSLMIFYFAEAIIARKNSTRRWGERFPDCGSDTQKCVSICSTWWFSTAQHFAVVSKFPAFHILLALYFLSIFISSANLATIL